MVPIFSLPDADDIQCYVCGVANPNEACDKVTDAMLNPCRGGPAGKGYCSKTVERKYKSLGTFICSGAEQNCLQPWSYTGYFKLKVAIFH